MDVRSHQERGHGAAMTKTGESRRRERRGRARSLIAILALGVFLSWVVAVVIAFSVNPRRGVTTSSRTWSAPDVLISTQTWRSEYGEYVEQTIEAGSKRSWGVEQLLGPPDTHGAGDLPTAWASSTPDGQEEWLKLEWTAPVAATSISVYQTYNAGAITQIAIGRGTEADEVIWRGEASPVVVSAPRVPGPEVLVAPVTPSRTIKTVLIRIDSPRVTGWNEIDAIGIRTTDGTMVYADRAEASSCYADRYDNIGASGNAAQRVPEWAAMVHPSGRDVQGVTTGVAELRSAGAFGWPMPAWAGYRRDSAPISNVTVSPGGLGVFPTAATTAPTGSVAVMSVIPYRPVWPGLLVNSVTGAIMFLILYGVLVYPLRPVRRVLRMQRGCCPACGYDLHFNFASGCSECGMLRGTARP